MRAGSLYRRAVQREGDHRGNFERTWNGDDFVSRARFLERARRRLELLLEQRAEHDGPRAIPEQHARRPILEVQEAREALGADDSEADFVAMADEAAGGQAIVAEADADAVTRQLAAAGETVHPIARITSGKRG